MTNTRHCLSVLACLALLAAPAVAAEPGFVSLFDGKTLNGWHCLEGSYVVEDGAIVCVAGGKGNLLSDKEYSDFVLRFQFRLTPGANNGLAVRSPDKLDISLHLEGTELQILDDAAEKYATLKPYQYHGSAYGIAPAKRGAVKPAGEWNTQEVTLKGRHLKVVVNGQTTVDVDLDEVTKDGTMDGTEHPGLKLNKGHIGFLGHGDRIDVKGIEIKELSK